MPRLLLTWLTSLFILVSFAQVKPAIEKQDPKNPDIKVTLLGTGTPQPIMDRFGASILVEAGSETLLFDAGRGCLQRLRQINIAYDKIDGLFLTHLHSDHIVGIPDLWLTGWLVSRRVRPLNVFGPKGTKKMLHNLREAYSYDISIRVSDDKRTEEGSKFWVTEIHEGVIYEKNGVKVIAFDVDHHPIVPAFGYRVEYNGHSVVLSGDTRYSENLARYAKEADLLIHEVAIAPDTLSKTDPQYNVLMHHTTPEQAAMIFDKALPKLAAFSHIVKIRGLTEEDIMKKTKAGYPGRVVMGEDLMSFSISDTVTVNKQGNNSRQQLP